MKILNKRLTLALFLVSLLACIIFHLLQYNWTIHARLNLLLQGHGFCRLQSPGKMKEQSLPQPTEFVSKLVYDGGVYVGYLNRYGDFIPAGRTSVGAPVGGLTLVIILLYGERLLLLVSSALLLMWLWRIRQERRLLARMGQVAPEA
jgi:hypothetical protein